MAKPKTDQEQGGRIPFDDALRRMLSTPPQPKVAAKKPAAKGKKKAR